jgi:DNA-directed RNA polymerase subunit RPC12/RpoP
MTTDYRCAMCGGLPREATPFNCADCGRPLGTCADCGWAVRLFQTEDPMDCDGCGYGPMAPEEEERRQPVASGSKRQSGG